MTTMLATQPDLADALGGGIILAFWIAIAVLGAFTILLPIFVFAIWVNVSRLRQDVRTELRSIAQTQVRIASSLSYTAGYAAEPAQAAPQPAQPAQQAVSAFDVE